MVSERRTRRLVALATVALGASCAHTSRHFSAKEPFWQDTDTRPFSVPCERRPTEKEPDHVACAPEPYVSPLIWDGADNSVFRPLAKVFAVDPPREAKNVNALDEVPNSAWFTNRIGIRRPPREELLRGACTPEEMLDGFTAKPGSFVIDQGKPNGASPGFRIKVDGKRKFMLKTDSKEQPERPSAASAIGAATYHAVGFNTSCEQVIFVDRSALSLQPGLKVTDNSGITRPFDRAALERVLEQAPERDGYVRLQASAWLPGYLLGPFRYEGTRCDDDNDVIPHEDRRDLRGARLIAAWLNHFDAREQNTMDSWIASGKVSDGSPGYVRHYYLDTSDCFGSEWDWDEISRRLGRSYVLDWADIGRDFITFGTSTRSWERVERTPGMEAFGYFGWREFDPETWKNEYPNPAFSRATERDNAWMARILSRFEPEDVRALVDLGKFHRADQGEYLAEVLEKRLQLILSRYLGKLSPIADVRVTGNRVCATDLARRRHVFDDARFRYTATRESDQRRIDVPVEVGKGGEICVDLAASSSHHGAPSSTYAIVTIGNGLSTYPLRVHVMGDDKTEGLRIVGLERLEEK
jgi:hypothetical protein